MDIAYNPVTLVYTNPFWGERDIINNLFEVCLSMRGYQHSHVYGVYDPTQEDPKIRLVTLP